MKRIIKDPDSFMDLWAAFIGADHLPAAIVFSGYVIFVCDDVRENCSIQSMASNWLGVYSDPPAFLNIGYRAVNVSSL